ncbi:hypothetical protein HPP92_003605 [Vanilla planifolia]|uniref:DYW domain-containing protein n=1 Tax=Vanilla planifolia TaxID=51239 RepID=A0A835S6I8_VANPL|nr:hypothetical protein HPP92_003605 [Vanilla planifolia]
MASAVFLPAKIPPPTRGVEQSVSSRQSPSLPPAKHRQVGPLQKRLIHLTDAGRVDDVFNTLDLMAERGVAADIRTYSALLRCCIRSRDLYFGRLLHRRLVLSGLSFDSVVYNSLITLYSKCGDWDSAFSVFNEMGNQRDLVSWTALISAAAEKKMEDRALSIFLEMLDEGFVPNEFTISSVIRACWNPYFFTKFGSVMFGSAVKTGFYKKNASVVGVLIDMFARNHDMVSARKVFDGMLTRNAVLWTLLITRYAQNGLGLNAIHLFVEMLLHEFAADPFNTSSAISACCLLESIKLGKQLHSLAIRTGLVSDICVGCALVDMYAKCTAGGSMDNARRVFDHIPKHNVMSWTAVISGYVQSGLFDEQAIKLFLKMLDGPVKPNHFTYSSIFRACGNLSCALLGQQVYAHVIKVGLASVNVVGNSAVTMFADSGRIDDARRAFEVIFVKNLVSYNSDLDGCVQNSHSESAIEVFHHIDLGPNPFTFASLLSSAAILGLMSKGQRLHSQLLKMGFETEICICNALVSMYSRCGNVEDAHCVFDRMSERNVISWTSMITGLAKHGEAHSALQLFHEMVSAGIKPNEITYVAVLSACSHAGLVSEGLEHFYSMERDHGLAPRMEHYACLVDLLGRSGHLQRALVFISLMPFDADITVWKTLLGACRIYLNVAIGEIAARKIIEMEPNDPAAYVLLSNLYAMAGRWEEVGRTRSTMKERGLSKEAGLSWIEIDGTMHRFHVGDTSHPRAGEIYGKLGELVNEIKEMGYVPDGGCVLHEVEEDMKEKYLLQHSEKIAVAFGLLCTASPRPIRVFKNLRVCGDCHTAVGYISMATGREIILRDSSRFHRFRDGECSCGGYW